jgi:hypothetical protein
VPPLEVPAAVPAVRHMPAIIRFLRYDPLPPTDSFSERLAIARTATAMPDFSRPECKRQYRPTAGELQRSGLVAPHRVCHDLRLVTGAFLIDPDSQFAEAKPTSRY